jgi:hypothetical protein
MVECGSGITGGTALAELDELDLAAPGGATPALARQPQDESCSLGRPAPVYVLLLRHGGKGRSRRLNSDKARPERVRDAWCRVAD